jgi:hypothetical protein
MKSKIQSFVLNNRSLENMSVEDQKKVELIHEIRNAEKIQIAEEKS